PDHAQDNCHLAVIGHGTHNAECYSTRLTVDILVLLHVYVRSRWPIKPDHYTWLKELHHTSWAVQDAAQTCDVIHLQSAQGLPCSRFVEAHIVCTLHCAHDPKLSEFYGQYHDVTYVCISEFKSRKETIHRLRKY